MESHIYIRTPKTGKWRRISFTKNVLLIQDNCAKIACFGKNCTDP